MRRPVLFLALALSIGSASAAPVSAASVDQLLAITKPERIMDQMYAGLEQNIRTGMMQAIGKRPLSTEQRRIIESAPAKLAEVLRSEFTWASMRPRLVQIYVETFEQEEVDSLIAFYSSPGGRAMIEKMPVVLQKSLELGQTQMEAALPRITAAMEGVMKELERTR